MLYEDLVHYIRTYESDTFSGIGSGIDKTEAEQVAQILIARWVNQNLDGQMIDGYLFELREEAGVKQL